MAGEPLIVNAWSQGESLGNAENIFGMHVEDDLPTDIPASDPTSMSFIPEAPITERSHAEEHPVVGQDIQVDLDETWNDDAPGIDALNFDDDEESAVRRVEPAPSKGQSFAEDDAKAPMSSSRGRTPSTYIVLVALDLSEPGGRAWRFAFDLAALRGEAEIHAIVVGRRDIAPEVQDVPTKAATTSAPSSLRLPPLKVLQHRSAGGQARLMAMHFRTGRREKAIVNLAEEIGADLIVIATQPTTPLQRIWGGSVADKIARTAPCPVVVVKPKRDSDDPGLETINRGVAQRDHRTFAFR